MRAWLRENFEAGQGVICPLCGQKVKLYHRVLSVATAKVMVQLFRRSNGREFLQLPPILDEMKGTAHQGGYGTLAHHWGLIEQMNGERQDGSKRVGWWRLTERGRMFVQGAISVPRTAYVYNNRARGFSAETITISEALKEPFDYRELMDGPE